MSIFDANLTLWAKIDRRVLWLADQRPFATIRVAPAARDR
jgi:hypothetical protein